MTSQGLRELVGLLSFDVQQRSSFSHFLGAHSHIRGLGLDDALEPRPVGVPL